MPNSSDRLSFTLFVAIAVHAVLIFGVTFTISLRDKVAPTLNITLATHKSQTSPDKADFLAQHNQEASGTETEVKELTTDLTADIADVVVNQVNPTEAQSRKVESEQQQEILITHGQSLFSVTSDIKVDDTPPKDGGESPLDSELSRTEKFASLQAKLDKNRQQMAREPRITRHTSVSAKSSDEASYYNSWSEKIVRVGNKNFPSEAIRKGIYGNLRLSVKIRADGSVANIEILQSSGHALLDDAALRILKLASPFQPFPPEIRNTTDIFEIIRTWKFEITGLTTAM